MSFDILIVDDTYEKTQVIGEAVAEVSGCEIECCNSSKQALRKMQNRQFDLLVVDLQIPPSVGEPVDQRGGLELIEYCQESESIFRPIYVIGVTSHRESYEECKSFFDNLGWPLLLGGLDKGRLVKMIKTKKAHSLIKSERVDVAIITALYKVELEAVLSTDCNWRELSLEEDDHVYYVGEVESSKGEKLKVLASCCSRMGMASAAATTMKVCSKFSPKTVFMTGIAAGVEGKTNFGDILVADPCWDWGSGKTTVHDGEVKQLNSPHQIPLKTSFRSKFQKISTTRVYLDEISSKWPHDKRPSNPLSLIVGPLATGASVLEDPETVRKIVGQHRETIGVEMEAYGFSYAASMADNDVDAAVVKSVCDFANPDKNDGWQKYAAFTSAQIVYKFIVNEL